MRDFVAGGKRWFALHGSNSVMDFQADGVHCPRDYPVLMETLGSQFIAHPAIEPYPITVSESARDHPLVAGIEPWECEDELYLCEYHGEITPLMETRFAGNSGPGFYEHDWPKDEPRLVMYLHPVGEGEVLYLTPGHRRSKYDMQDPPLSVEEWPVPELGAWTQPPTTSCSAAASSGQGARPGCRCRLATAPRLRLGFQPASTGTARSPANARHGVAHATFAGDGEIAALERLEREQRQHERQRQRPAEAQRVEALDDEDAAVCPVVR